MSKGDATTRFSGRVDDYVKTRPSYPHGVLAVLREECDLGPTSVVADLGSGTGLFTRLLLASGATVRAVEPNDEMLAAAEALLGTTPGFHSVAGRAEATALADASVDLVTAAQAFHWFDVPRARVEIARILRHPTKGTSITNGVAGITNGVGAATTVTFVVPNNAPATLYYDCGNHFEMHGTINVIVDAVFKDNFEGP